MMRDGDIVEMDVGESLGWVGFAGVDADMRLLCGLKARSTSSTRPPISSRRRTCDRRQARHLQRRLRRRPDRRLQEALGREVNMPVAAVATATGVGDIGTGCARRRESLQAIWRGARARQASASRFVAARCMACSEATVRASRRSSKSSPASMPRSRAARIICSGQELRVPVHAEAREGARPRLRPSESRD